ncbi:biliverdin-producing heme oxygenase [Rhodobacter sp. Har01]|uniref:biliverdin-producing heme oxygenase n=1 Tax=Rhodobacter sp. Har01 TaxID=2883999 RepID=UPI001D07C317|nr:biliverdin-producing heme oxygenase [Rhodobacter sp. Har01]MCB6179471.1 biliverdin-producing heme oxygenase [Rhodobacter sp. Har01]
MATDDTLSTTGRADALRAATDDTHKALDAWVMAANPFASHERYGRYLLMQYEIHRDVAGPYADPALNGLIPGLARMARLEAVAADLTDLGLACPGGQAEAEGAALPEALGWLYVVEGSNLGGAFLLKAAKSLGLGETHGARHMVDPDEGPAAVWRAFKAGLEAPVLTAAEEARVIAGAEAAFARAHALARAWLG